MLQNLEIIDKSEDTGNGDEIDFAPIKEFLFNLIKTQSFMGIMTLISQCIAEFSDVSESDVKLLIQSLCDESKVKIMNPKAKLEDQLICLIA